MDNHRELYPYTPPRPSTSNTYDSGSLTAGNTSPRQPPAYGDEPPQYQDEVPYDEKARERKTIFVRLLTSIFITVIVSLIVAAVVEKIHRHGAEMHHEAPTRSVQRITVASAPATSVARDAVEATADAGSSPMPTPTPAPELEAKPSGASSGASSRESSRESSTQGRASPSPTTVACSSMVRLPASALWTSFRPTATRGAESESAAAPAEGHRGRSMQAIEIYSFRGCRWTRMSYRGDQGAVTRLCTVECRARVARDDIMRRAAAQDST